MDIPVDSMRDGLDMGSSSDDSESVANTQFIDGFGSETVGDDVDDPVYSGWDRSRIDSHYNKPRAELTLL